MERTNDFMHPQCTDWETYAADNNMYNRLVRYWVKDEDCDGECDFGFIRHIVEMPNGSLMVAIAPEDERREDGMYPCLSFYNWDDVKFMWFEGDEE